MHFQAKKIIAASLNGTLHRYENFFSRFIEPRNVDIWLPADYDISNRYPVIYMHDGQNLFQPQFSYSGIDWGIDEAITKLSENESYKTPLIVAVWNTEKRWQEYMPEQAFELLNKRKITQVLSQENNRSPCSDRYLKFIITELKPFIDKTYPILNDSNNNFIMGSSMGALVSLYALCEYPDIFRGAACLSTHWIASKGIMLEYLKASLPPAGKHKFYFDYGTKALDAAYHPYQLKADTILKKAGYRKGKDLLSLCFQGADHTEAAWRKRIAEPLQFLGKNLI